MLLSITAYLLPRLTYLSNVLIVQSKIRAKWTETRTDWSIMRSYPLKQHIIDAEISQRRKSLNDCTCVPEAGILNIPCDTYEQL